MICSISQRDIPLYDAREDLVKRTDARDRGPTGGAIGRAEPRTTLFGRTLILRLPSARATFFVRTAMCGTDPTPEMRRVATFQIQVGRGAGAGRPLPRARHPLAGRPHAARGGDRGRR